MICDLLLASPVADHWGVVLNIVSTGSLEQLKYVPH